jgi:hypothetical protein
MICTETHIAGVHINHLPQKQPDCGYYRSLEHWDQFHFEPVSENVGKDNSLDGARLRWDSRGVLLILLLLLLLIIIYLANLGPGMQIELSAGVAIL